MRSWLNLGWARMVAMAAGLESQGAAGWVAMSRRRREERGREGVGGRGG